MQPEIADFVAPLQGNQRCHGDYFVPYAFGVRPNVSPQLWTWSDQS